MGYIYQITNTINNKIYIGKTITCIQERFSKHIYEAYNNTHKGYNFVLHKAIRKYGKENFTIKIIEECDNNILSQREIYWIEQKQSRLPAGYNMTYGGEGSIKINYSEVYKLWDSGLCIAQISKQIKHSISQIKTILSQYKNFTTEENNQRTINLTKKKVAQYDKNNQLIKIFDSIKDAAITVNVDRSCISRCCSGQKKTSRGYIWKYITPEEAMKIYG